MRILVTAFTFAPQVNGVAEVVGVHVEHLVRRGHEVTVATGFDPARIVAPETNQNPCVVHFKVSGTGNLRSRFRGEIKEYQDFIRRWKGDIIMCHCWQSWCTDLAFPCFPDNAAKKVLISHGFSLHHYPVLVTFPRGLVTWLAWRPYVWRAVGMMRRFDRVVFLADLVNRAAYYDHWLAKRRNLQNTCVIPTGVYPEEFESDLPDFRAAHGIGAERLVLCLSNYDPHKNQLMALKAFAKAKVNNAVLAIVGKEFNEYTALLQDWYAQAGGEEVIGRVLFLEKLDRKMARAAFRAADLFLCSSLWESGPLIVLEAMASRTAFVSTNVGFVATLPGGVVVADENEMAAAIQKLLNDDERRLQLAQEGRTACEKRFHWSILMKQYDALLQSLVGDRSASLTAAASKPHV